MAISSAMGSAGAVPIGVVNPFAGATAPSGWLLCFGQAVSRSQYSALFAVLNTTYGAGDGSTTFTLPDMRGRSVSGKDNMGGTTAGRITAAVTGVSGTTLGNAGGTQNPPLHNHTINHDHGSFSATSNGMNSNASHSHSISASTGGAGGLSISVTDNTSNDFATFMNGGRANSVNIDHSHTTNIDVPNFTGSSGNTGTGTSGNLPPTIILNYIIKAQ